MTICPVCNGFSTIQEHCPACSALMEDLGKMSDFLGPYSPYREIDHINMSNGYRDVEQHLCLHVTYCPVCRNEMIISIEKSNQNS